jgi:CTP synthase (UTP-ammonia lyase)
MDQRIQVGIIGDYNPQNPTHVATNEAISHGAKSLAITVEPVWLPTPALDDESFVSGLKTFDALWCSPGSPYQSMSGALRAIRFAREENWPFIGT